MKLLLKYVPGLIGGGLVAVFFAQNSAQQMILAFIVAGLITLVIAQAAELQRIKEVDDSQDQRMDIMVTEFNHRVTSLAETTSENFSNLADAFDNDMHTLADQVGTEIHELAVLIADTKYGDGE